MSEYGTLSADGAARLRAVRDYIVAHPDEFNMEIWECGTTACIGGHLTRQARLVRPWDAIAAANLLGFKTAYQGPAYELFFSPEAVGIAGNIEKAVEHINAFLWRFGYPEHELPTIEPAQVQA